MIIEDILIENILEEICQQDNPIEKIRTLIKSFDQVICHYPQYKNAYRCRGIAKLKLSEIAPAFENPGAIITDALQDLYMS